MAVPRRGRFQQEREDIGSLFPVAHLANQARSQDFLADPPEIFPMRSDHRHDPLGHGLEKVLPSEGGQAATDKTCLTEGIGGR